MNTCDAPLRIGYARVSSGRQKMRLQLHALELAGCDIAIGEAAGGGNLERSGLEAALLLCRPGDELVVWRLDRLSRRQLHVGQVLDYFASNQIGFHVAQGVGRSIDASTPEGRTLLQLLAGFAEYEWEAIKARSDAGRSARRNGSGGQGP